MTLEERIHDRIIIYNAKQSRVIALELALLYLELAERKTCKLKIQEACYQSILWLKNAGMQLPNYIEKLSGCGQLEELEKILANAKVTVA